MSLNRILYNIAKFGVRKLVDDRKLRTKAVSFVNDQVIPQAKAQWETTKPRLEQATNNAVDAAKDVADVARENDPREDPKIFLSEVSQRLRNRVTR